MPRLCLSLLGPMQVTLNDKELTSHLLAKHLALIAYLAVEANRPQHRETLAGKFWPNQPESSALHSLRETFYQLRKVFGDFFPEFLIVTSKSVQLNTAGDSSLDTALFTGWITECYHHIHRRVSTCKSCIRNLQLATSLYRGEFLEGLFLRDNPGFEEWVLVERDRLARMASSSYHILAEYHQERCEFQLMEQYAWRQIEINPYQENAHRKVMRALAWAGNKTAALAHYDNYARMLSGDLNALPERRTTALQIKIKESHFATPNPRQLYNWFDPLTSFIGRDQEIKQISELLQNPEVRLITLAGPGGIGKSRLALKAVFEEAYSFRDGACYVSLTSIQLPEDFAIAIANALEIPLNGPQELGAHLKTYLRQKEMILLLDNLENGSLARDQIHDLLNTCPSLTVVVTCLESLGLQDEWLLPIQGLSTPDTGSLINLEQFDAVKLFLKRVYQVRPDYVLKPSERSAVADICQSVGGMPLALELAANWTKVLSCHEIASEIKNNWKILSSEETGYPVTHRSLHNVLDRTWHLLNTPQQKALKNLSVFNGGFSHTAAAHISGTDKSMLLELVNRSLLKLSTNDRFQMHPLIQQYAYEKLRGVPDEKQFVEERHGHYYAEFALHQAGRMKGPEQMQAVSEFDLEIENVRKAWEWAIDALHMDSMERLRDGFGFYCRTKGRYQTGKKIYGQAVDAIRKGNPRIIRGNPRYRSVLGSMLVGQGICSFHLGELLYAWQQLSEGLDLLKGDGPPREIAFALAWLGAVTIFSGDYQHAVSLTQDALLYARRSEDPWTIGMVLMCLGHATRPTDFVKAVNYYEESSSYFQALGDHRTLATTTCLRGEIILRNGNPTAAKSLFEESLKLAIETDSNALEARGLAGLAEVAYAAGRYLEARRLLATSLEIFKKIGERRVILSCLSLMGAVMYRINKPGKAGEYYREAIMMGQEMHATPLLLGCLVFMAEPFIDEDETKRRFATELLGHVLHNPQSIQEDIFRVEQLLSRLKMDLPPLEYESFLQKGSTASVESLLVEMTKLLKGVTSDIG
jgi:predicted ATPase/DNA-binding SARP family transcriptional activator